MGEGGNIPEGTERWEMPVEGEEAAERVEKKDQVEGPTEPKPRGEYTPQEISDISEGVKNFFERMDASREERELREVFELLIEKLNRLSREQQDRAKAFLSSKAKEAHTEEDSLKDAYSKIIDLMNHMIEIIDSNVK